MSPEGERPFPVFIGRSFQQGVRFMFDFLQPPNWGFWVGLLILGGLIGVFLYLRSKRPED